MNRLGTGLEDDPLMHGREKRAVPVRSRAIGLAARVGKHDEGGKVVAERAKTIRQPRPERGETVEHEPAVFHEERRGVIGALAVHRADDRQLIGHLGDLGKQVGDPKTTRASLMKRPIRLAKPAHLAEEEVGLLVGLERLAVRGNQLRLVVERIEMAHPADDADLHAALRLGSEMRRGLA